MNKASKILKEITAAEKILVDLKRELREAENPPKTFKIGDRFKIGKATYILALVSDTAYALVNLASGRLWTFPIQSRDITSRISVDTLAQCGTTPEQKI